MHMHVCIPANTTATVTLPGANLRDVLDNPLCQDLRGAAQAMEQTDDGVRAEIGSGEYTFGYRI